MIETDNQSLSIYPANHPFVTRFDLEAAFEMAKREFPTDSDPNLTNLDTTSFEWDLKTIPSLWRLAYVGTNLAGYIYMLPSSLEIMESFAKGELNEAQVFEQLRERDTLYRESIYIAAVVVDKECRGRGLAKELIMEAVNSAALEYGRDIPFYYWPYSKEGASLFSRMAPWFEEQGFRLVCV